LNFVAILGNHSFSNQATAAFVSIFLSGIRQGLYRLKCPKKHQTHETMKLQQQLKDTTQAAREELLHIEGLKVELAKKTGAIIPNSSFKYIPSCCACHPDR